MEIKKLQQRQLFCSKRETVEKKVVEYFKETQDVDSVIEYAVAIMVRHALVMGDFSFLFQDVIREIYLHAHSSATMTKFMPYFQMYFSDSEWKQLIKRLFINERKYKKATRIARRNVGYLTNCGSGVVEREYESYVLHSIFADANGKRHIWRLRDADPRNTTEETKRILEILTTLTIFQNGGVRRFAQYIHFDCIGSSLIFSSRAPKQQTQTALTQNKQEALKQSAAATEEFDLIEGYDLNAMSKETLILLIKSILKEAKAAMLKEELLFSDEQRSEIEQSLGDQTRLEDRIVSTNKENNHASSADLSSTDERTEGKILGPGLALADSGIEVSDEERSPEKPVIKKNKKKISKKDRKLLKEFQMNRRRK